MCWKNVMTIPIVLKKPLKVYKVGTSTTLDNFISLYQTFWYYKNKIVPTIKLNPKFVRLYPPLSFIDVLWDYDGFYIHEGYHSYLTKKMARRNSDKDNDKDNDIGIFEIPAGATIYVNYKDEEVVSTNIRYLELLELPSM